MCGRLSVSMSKLPFRDRLMKLGFKENIDSTYRNSGKIFFRMPEAGEKEVHVAKWVGHARSERLGWWMQKLAKNGRVAKVVIPGFDHLEHFDLESRKTIVLDLEKPANFIGIAHVPHGRKEVLIRLVTSEQNIGGRSGRWPTGDWSKQGFSLSFKNGRSY